MRARASLAILGTFALATALAGQASPRPPHEAPATRPPVAESDLPTARSSAQPVVFGGFASLQVNVDENGMNVIGDAGNEPTLAVSPLDRRKIAVGWRQFDSIASDFRQAGLNVSFDGGRSWEAKTVLGPGVFGSDPVLDAAADGTFHYMSLHGTPNYFTTLYRSFDDGRPFRPQPLSLRQGGWISTQHAGRRDHGVLGPFSLQRLEHFLCRGRLGRFRKCGSCGTIALRGFGGRGSPVVVRSLPKGKRGEHAKHGKKQR